MAESLAGIVRVFGVDGLEGLGTGNEHHHAPVAVGIVVPVGFALGGGHKAEHAAVYVVGTLGLELAAYVGGYSLNVVLQQLYILEDGVVDALQHVVGRIAFGRHLVGVVYQSVTQGSHRDDGRLDLKLSYNSFQFFFVHVFMICNCYKITTLFLQCQIFQPLSLLPSS